MVKTIDMTPTWKEILPTWLRIAREAYQQKQVNNIYSFEQEMARMAEAADKWNAWAKENVPVEDEPDVPAG